MNRTLQQPENEIVNEKWKKAEVLHKRVKPTLERNRWKEVWELVFDFPFPSFEDAEKWASNGDNDRFLFPSGQMLELKLSGRFELRQFHQGESHEEEKKEGKTHVQYVAEFIKGMPDDQQKIPDQPLDVPRVSLKESIATLILEEAIEAIEGLGLKVFLTSVEGQSLESAKQITVKGISFHDDWPYDRKETADGLGDLSVVTMGAFLRLGIDPRPILKAIDKANLDKLKPGHSFRTDGKLIKPDDWTPPAISIRPYRDEG